MKLGLGFTNNKILMFFALTNCRKIKKMITLVNVMEIVAVAIMLPLRDNNAKVSASVTLFSDELIWNGANQYCRSIGQHLVKIGRQAKEHYLHEHLVSLNISPSKVDIWIGLHAPDPNQQTHLVWTNNCSIPLLYSNWEPGLKSGPNDLCAYIEVEYESMYWFLDECEKTKRSFLCESKQGICNSGYFYDTESDTSVATGIGGLTTMSSVTVQQCKNACNPSPMCWGFVFIPSVPKCALFDLNDDPLFIENNQVHAQYHDLYMKRCHFEVDENTNVLSVPSYDSSGSDAVSECMTTTNEITTTRQKTTIDQTTAETMIPSTNANLVTSSNYHVTTRQQTTIDQATPETMIPSTNANHVTSSNYHVTTRQQTTIYQTTADAMILTTNANHVTSSNYHVTTRQQTTIDQTTADAMIPTTNANHVTSSNYHVTTLNPETTSTEKNLINPTTIQKVSTYSKGKNPYCVCTCNNATKEMSLEESITEIVNAIKVDKSQTSTYTRQRTCAWDSRKSSESIGYVGIVILVLIVSLLICLDSSPLIYKITSQFKKLTTKSDSLC